MSVTLSPTLARLKHHRKFGQFRPDFERNNMAKDLYHLHVIDALARDGWIITHDPLYLRGCFEIEFL
jgi:hypothetical protein